MSRHTPQIIIVGAGLSGSVLAERFAARRKRVLVLEKRDHIGGNCYDYVNKQGLLVSKYGPHLFHTNKEDVWAYVRRFASWNHYELRVVAKVDGILVPVPVNIVTVNKLLKKGIKNSKQMDIWLQSVQRKKNRIRNGEDAARARVGDYLYEKIFKNYTKKQWDKDPSEIDASVLNRIPVRNDFEDRYFTDTYQALPVGGYTKFIQNMLTSDYIEVRLNTDYFEVKDSLKKYEKIFYTGPIDRFFDYKYSVRQKLEYRSLRFEHETYDKEYYQEAAVINYPNEEKFTRAVEYKRLTLQSHPKTTVVREYPTWDGEPFYPVPNLQNRTLYEKYRIESAKLKDVFFVGRLANYKYFNMDEAIENALELAKTFNL